MPTIKFSQLSRTRLYFHSSLQRTFLVFFRESGHIKMLIICSLNPHHPLPTPLPLLVLMTGHQPEKRAGKTPGKT